MRLFFPAAVLAAACFCRLCAAAQGDPNLVAPTDPLPPHEQKTRFRLPPGFEIQLIVAEPEIGQPTNIAFDASGRLWINSSVEYPYPAAGPPRDRLRYMDDSDGDGVPDLVRTFADRLNIPIGVAKVKDGVLAYSIPDVYLFRDSNGDGKADRRDPVYTGFDATRDTHGMASSFRPWIDGWVYGCHGFANDSAVRGADGVVVKMHSGNTYRLRPDGSHIQQWTWGQVNPYGLAFDPLGNLYSADCHSKPVYQLLRGAYYPSFGKPHDGLGFGPEMIEHLHGSTGIAGVVYYAADQWPPEYRDNLFIGNPVTGRINRDRLERRGSTVRALEAPDFVSCDDPWFRPVDLALAPDGSLYVADFYNCIIGHYEVRLDHPRRDREMGRIWRIAYAGTPDAPPPPPRPTPDLTRLDLASLIAKLSDPNLQVRVLATNEIVDRFGPSAAAPVRERLAAPDATPEERAHGLWIVERLQGLDDREVEALSRDPAPIVRVHLMKALAERDEPSATGLDVRSLIVERLLKDEDAFVRRAAADALGRRADPRNAAPLVEAWRAAPSDDSHLIHVVRMALRDSLKESGDLSELAAELGGDDDLCERFADVSLGLPTAGAASYLLERLATRKGDPGRRLERLQHACRRLPDERLDELFDAVRTWLDEETDAQPDVLRTLFNAMHARGTPPPREFVRRANQAALRRLQSPEPDVVPAGLDLARDLKLKGVFDAVCAVAERKSSPPALRVRAVDAMLAIDPAGAAGALIRVVRDPECDPLVRNPAAEFLGKTRTGDAVAALAEVLAVAPADFAVWLARGLSWSDAGADVLLRSIEEGKASAELLNDGVVAHELRFRAAPDKDRRIDELKRSIPSPDEAIRKLIDDRRAGFLASVADVAHGEAAFQKHCANCHQIAGRGAKVGPQLDGVGVRGLDRLLEDVLDPDRNVDQAFRKTTFLMQDGTVASGLLLRREGAVLVVADAQGREVRIAEEEVEERRDSKASPMPNDVAKGLAPQELFDLIAYLLAQRER